MAARLLRLPTILYPALVVALATTYFVTAKASLLLAIPPGYATAVWPPSGIALAALLLYGTRLWPGVWLGAALANFTIDHSVGLTCVIATGNTLEVVCAAWLAQRLMDDAREFRRADSVFRFALVAAIGGAIAASTGLLALYAAGEAAGQDVLTNWYTWWQGDVTGIILLTPFLLAWLRPQRAPGHNRGAETVLFAGLFAIAFVAIFGVAWRAHPDISRALVFLLVPFMAWAGCRFDGRAVTATTLIAAAVVIGATLAHHSPFLFASPNESLLALQAFNTTVALVGLVLYALTREREDAAARLSDAHNRSEATVAERTRELARKNDELARDVAERARLASAMQAREEQMAEAQAITHVGSWSWDVKTDRVSWSDELYRIYGIGPEEFTGTLAGYLARVHPDDRVRVTEVVRLAMANRESWELSERIVRPDGSVRTLKTLGRVLTDEAGRIVSMYGACLDVTEALRLQQIQAVQNQITTALLYAPTWRDAMSSAMQVICETAGWTLGQMWEVDESAQVLRHVSSWHPDGAAVTAFVTDSADVTFSRGVGLPGRTWEQTAPMWIEDVVHDPSFPRADMADRAGLHGAFAFPLIASGKVLGVVEFLSTDVQQPQQELVSMLTAVGNQLGEYIVRDRSETLLRQSEERFHLLVQGVKDYAIFMLAPDGYITTWNAGAERIKGYQAEEVIGSHYSRFYPVEDVAAGKPARLLQAALTEGAVKDEGWRVRKDGSRFWANVVITPLYDPEGRLRGFAKVTRDMSDRKRVEALEEAGQQTRDFLAMLAHELRNPLAPLRNAVSVLRNRATGDHMLEASRDMIARQVDHLARLVDDLLDVSRITTGKIGLQRERVDAAAIVSGAVESCRSMIDAKSQALELDFPREAIWINADPTRLSQVVQNLVNNAVKYTPVGGRIEVGLHREGESAVIRVEDNGIGIAPAFLPKVFDLFVQANSALARTEGGLGLGLALVRQIVEMHGGSVEAASEGEGRGARFTVRLPSVARGAEAPEQPQSKAIAEPEAPVPRRILIVDDNRDSAESMAMLLQLSGHATWIAYDGHAALALATEHAPEVVLLDIGLPGMDGYQVARKLRELPQTCDSLLIALTGYGQADDRRRSAEAGFDGHFVKPVDIDALHALIAGHRRAAMS
jgi:PAS domain S-box-containing protein